MDYLWWTWDLGKPTLIQINLKLQNKNTNEVIYQNMTTGIRTVNVIQ